MNASTATPDQRALGASTIRQTLASFIREMTSTGMFGHDERGIPVGPRPWNRQQARAAVGGRNHHRGRRNRARLRAFNRERGIN